MTNFTKITSSHTCYDLHFKQGYLFQQTNSMTSKIILFLVKPCVPIRGIFPEERLLRIGLEMNDSVSEQFLPLALHG